jgi:hypothetical protein
MTRDELVNNFSFKSSIKALKKNFPFVKDVVPGYDFENDLANYDSFYTIDLIIDGDKFFEMYPDFYNTLWHSLKREYEQNKKVKLSFSEFYKFDEAGNLDLSADELRKDMYALMGKRIKDINKSEVVPEEFQLNRSLYPGYLLFEK